MRYPNWGSHALLGRIAYDGLPDWQKQLIRPDMSPAALNKPYLNDRVKTVGDKMGALCGILDMVYYDECRPYATLPDGRWIPHSPPDDRWQSCAGSGRPRSRVAGVELTAWLLRRMVDAVRAGDWEAGVRHGGAMAHFLQEPFTPGHAIDNDLFHQFFPDPDPSRHIRIHHAFDAASGDYDPRPPVLMGTGIEEAAYRLQLELELGMRRGVALVAPLVRSVHDGEPDTVRRQLLAGQSRDAAFVTTSAWYTAICIALDRFESDEVDALRTLALTGIPPYFVHHWQYVDVLPGHLVREGRKIPLHVWQATPGGEREEVRIEDGFGMGGHMGIKFFVDGTVYPRFQCRVGLPSRHTEGQDAHMRTRFFVEMDREFNTTYSEDIEYGAQTLAQVDLEPGAPVQAIDVDVSGARTLLLRAQSQGHTDPATGQIRWSIPHVAVCEPVLRKA